MERFEELLCAAADELPDDLGDALVRYGCGLIDRVGERRYRFPEGRWVYVVPLDDPAGLFLCVNVFAHVCGRSPQNGSGGR